MSRWALVLMMLATACGNGGRRPGADRPVVKRQPVKRDALREFDSALRALRLGGPEANERASERFQDAAELDPTLWEAWHDVGVVYTREGDHGAALDAFDEALKINPDSMATRLARAEAARALRKTGTAKSDYMAVLVKDPTDNTTRLRLAALLREAGELDQCLKIIRDALRQKSDDPRAYVELGLYYLAQGQEEFAELVLGKAAERDPKNPLVWNALALLSLRAGRDQEAFTRFDHATSLDPSFKDARFNKASVLMDAGDYKRALPELEAVVASDSEDLEAQIALGVAYRGVGAYDRATATWESVLKNAPRQPDALWNLAVLDMDFRRQPDKAKDRLARYLQAAPEDHPRRKDAEQRMSELGDGK